MTTIIKKIRAKFPNPEVSQQERIADLKLKLHYAEQTIAQQSLDLVVAGERIVAKERQLAEASEFVAVNKGLLAAAHLRIAIKDAALDVFFEAYCNGDVPWREMVAHISVGDLCRAAEARKL